MYDEKNRRLLSRQNADRHLPFPSTGAETPTSAIVGEVHKGLFLVLHVSPLALRIKGVAGGNQLFGGLRG